MDFNKLTIKAQEAVAAAQELARRRANPEITPEHLLLALLDQELFAEWRALRAEAEAKIAALPTVQGGQQQPNVSAAFSRVLDRADDERRKLEDDYVSTEHLFLAIEPVPRDEIVAWIEKVRGGQHVTSQDPEGTYQALEKFGRDLTEAAEAGKLDPVIGRDEEIRRVIQVLSRRTKNNPVLIGEPGVGKTAIAEGLAQRIVAGDVPGRIEGSPRLGARPGCAARRREVPGRLRGAPQGRSHRDQELGRPDHPLHRRAAHDRRRGSRRRRGRRREPAQAAARARRAPLRRRDDARRVPQVHREGRRTRAALRAGLRRRTVGADTIAILRGLKERYEAHHGVRIRDAALVAAAVLSHRYVADRFLPDKAIDLVDEAAARLRIEIDSSPLELDEANRRVMQLEIELAAMAKENTSVREPVERALAEAKEERNALAARWAKEKEALERVKEMTRRIDELRQEAERAEREAQPAARRRDSLRRDPAAREGARRA